MTHITHGNGATVQLRVQIGNHSLFVSRDLEDQIEKLLAPVKGGKVHLEVIRVDVEKEASIVTFVVSEKKVVQCHAMSACSNLRHGLDHGCREEPLVDLFTFGSTRTAFAETLETQVPDLQRLLLRIDVDRDVAGHVHLGGLPNQDLQTKRTH